MPPYAFTRMFKRMVGISPSEYKIRYESYVKADFSSFRLFNAKFLCVLVQSMLPEDVTLENGHIIHRPGNWK